MISLIISILLFVYVNLEEEQTVQYNTTVIIKNIPQNLTLVTSSISNVNITLTGKKQSFLIMPSNITTYLDLSNAIEGTEEYKILIDNIYAMPKSIKYVMSPESVYITLKNKE